MFDGLFDLVKDTFAWLGKALLWVVGGLGAWKATEAVSGKDLGFSQLWDGAKDGVARIAGSLGYGEREIGNLDKYVKGQLPAWEEYKKQHAGEVVNHKIPLAYTDIKAVSGKGERDIKGKVKHHDGIDLQVAGVANPNILASEKGKVLYSGEIGGYGNTVIIGHADGTLTLYAHMQNKSNDVIKVGDDVKQGQKIGVMGNTGHSEGTHLHYEQRIGTERTIVPVLPEMGDLSHDIVNDGVKSKNPDGKTYSVSPAASAASVNGYVPVNVPSHGRPRGGAVQGI